MSDGTAIEWTDATWNVITGCSVHSPGCKNCYAMKLAGTRLRNHPSRIGLTHETSAGPVWTGDVRFNEQWLDQPSRWRKPRMIFVCAHGDLFHESVPDAWIDKVFLEMRFASHHTFQVLTKRADRMLAYIDRFKASPRWDGWITRDGTPSDEREGSALFTKDAWPLRNVWLGTSIEDQRRADEKLDAMRTMAAAGWLTWVSYEPALGPVDWASWTFLRWMVSGGESGEGARPSHPDWHRTTRNFCAAAGVPFLFKQWGEWLPESEGALTYGDRRSVRWPDSSKSRSVGKKAAGRLLDGLEHNGYPEVTP